MSAGDPILPSGCIETDAFKAFSLLVIDLVKGVLINPGATQFTLIFLDAYVAAADFVNPIIPALAQAIAS